MNLAHSTRRLVTTALAAVAVFTSSASAQNWPTRPIRLVNPYAVGGPVDDIARDVAVGLSSALGQQVLVDVKSGGGTVIGANIVAKSPADGYTLLLGTQAPLILQPAINPKIPYDARRDFVPVAMFVTVPGLISVPASSPITTLGELVEAARRKPGSVTYASAGVGTGSHLGGELFARLTGTRLLHVPYRGAAPGTVALLGGEIDVGFVNITPQIAHVKSGKLRALAVTGSGRSTALPDVPTASEAGVKGLVAESWYGLFAPAGTPPVIVERIAGAMKQVVTHPDTSARLAKMGGSVTLLGPQAFASYLAEDEKRLTPIIRSLDLKSE